MTGTLKTAAMAALAPLALLALSACSEGSETIDTANTAEPGSETLATALANEDDLSSLAGAWTSAGLTSALDGAANYTVLAPDNAAFDSLGDRAQWLLADEQQPILAALLRDHMVPGALDPAAIRAAIEAKGGPVTMTTFGEGDVTFSLDGDTLIAKGTDGSEARLSGEATIASNGVVIPVGGLLHELPDAQGAAPDQ